MAFAPRSALIIPAATASGAPSWPDPATAARKPRTLPFQASPADSRGGVTARGEAASNMPVPGAIRPVPNRLFIVSAHVTALPSRSTTLNPVDAGNAGREPQVAVEASKASGSPPP